MITIHTPLTKETIQTLRMGDKISISGELLAGRDAALPKLFLALASKTWDMDLTGYAVFHTAVSIAGVGPTSSNKLEIEESIAKLSEFGIRMHIGKGALRRDTIEALDEYDSVYAVIPPVTALLKGHTLSQRVVAFSELGMEALYILNVEKYPAIIAAAHGCSLFDQQQ
jgi:fumarate hydratase subunit beta